MFEKFKIRSHELERLDTGDYTAAEFELWKREMRVIHSVFGERRALRRSLVRAIEGQPGRSISIIDVGAGTGELLLVLKRWLTDSPPFLVGAEITTDGAKAIRSLGIETVQCDGLRLPFADNSVDYVFCSLFLHHLSDNDATQLLREMGRVARETIFAIDLNRHPTAYYLYRALGKILLQKFTLDDGSLSILRSFTAEELAALAERAGLRNVTVSRSRVNRLILSARGGEIYA